MTESLTTSHPDVSLRFAVQDDCSLILSFIRSLAVHSKLAHEVVATEDSLRTHLFGDRPIAEAIIAEYKSVPVGYVLFFYNFSTFLGRPGLYIEDLFVNQDCRGQGIGKQLLASVAQVAVQRGCGRLEWGVLDWDDLTVRMYTSIGAQRMEEWTMVRVSGPALASLGATRIIARHTI